MKEKKEREPIFIPRGDGLGWTFNFYNKWSYVVLLVIIAFVVCCVYLSITAKK